MKVSVVFIILVFAIIGCNKDKVEADNIYSIENANFILNAPPLKTDSTVSINLDFDHDGLEDFQFQIRHRYLIDAKNRHLTNISYVVISLQSENLIGQKADGSTRAFGFDDPIDFIQAGSAGILYYLTYYYEGGGSWGWITGQYISFKLGNKMGWFLINNHNSNNAPGYIEIKSWGINMTENKPIKAGQTK